MLKIGLTGGIGCGKTTVSNLFKQQGAPIIDADVIAHQIVQPGEPALAAIKAAFGAQIINPDESLNRNLLRDWIFSDNSKKKQLEAILHPLIFAAMQTQVDKCLYSYVVLSIPLLIETNSQSFVDRILVVDCSQTEQIARVRKRNNLSNERIQSIIDAQTQRQQRLAAADDIINNNGSISALAEQVKKLHNLYLVNQPSK